MTHLSSSFKNVICNNCTINGINNIQSRIVKEDINTRYVIIFRILDFNKDNLEYKLIESIRRGQFSENFILRYIPLIIVISPRPPNYSQKYIDRSDFLPYQVTPNTGKMILNDAISDYDFNMEVTIRNTNELKKYDIQRSEINKQIDDFKKEYISKNVTTADTSLLIKLEDQLKQINEAEQRFKRNIDQYFREIIGCWNVSQYAHRMCNYVKDYTLVEMKVPIINKKPSIVKEEIYSGSELKIPIPPLVSNIQTVKKEETNENHVIIIKPKESTNEKTMAGGVILGRRRSLL